LPDCEFVIWHALLQGYEKETTLMLEKGELRQAQNAVAEMFHPAGCVEQLVNKCQINPANINLLGDNYGANLCAIGAAESRIWTNSCQYLQCHVQAVARLQRGDEFLQSAQDEIEGANMMEFTYLAMDEFRGAVLSAKEVDVETEAAALSRLGRCFTKMLKQEARGKNCYQQSVVLGLTMQPRVMDGVAWFKEATAAVKAFQDRLAETDADYQERKKAPFKEALKEEIAAIKNASEKGVKTLLDHVYKMHPPRNPKDVREKKKKDAATGKLVDVCIKE